MPLLLRLQEGKCFYCGGTGHWKHNGKAFLESQKKEHDDASSSGINVVEVNASTAVDNQTWVLDTRCGSHLVSSGKELRSSRKVEKGVIDLHVANGARVAALAVGLYHLSLPLGMELILDNCYNVPCLSRNIISISCLVEQGFEIIFLDKQGTL